MRSWSKRQIAQALGCSRRKVYDLSRHLRWSGSRRYGQLRAEAIMRLYHLRNHDRRHAGSVAEDVKKTLEHYARRRDLLHRTPSSKMPGGAGAPPETDEGTSTGKSRAARLKE